MTEETLRRPADAPSDRTRDGRARATDPTGQAGRTPGTSSARPRRDRAATRRRLLDAAWDLFGQHGYDGVSLRMIATAAGANVALVNRYFGSKAQLFAEAVEGQSTMLAALQGDRAHLERRLAEYWVRQATSSPAPLARIVDRSFGSPEVRAILRAHMDRVLVEPLTAQLEGPDARGRATLAAAMLLTNGPLRRLLSPGDLSLLDHDDLVDRVTRVLEITLADSGPVRTET